MGFSSIKSFVNSMESGQTQITNFRKVLTYAGVNGVWTDISMSSGNPRPNFYAATPLESSTLNGNFGIYHGANVTSGFKHLSKITLSNGFVSAAIPVNFRLLDYLLFYPFIDGNSTDEQLLTTSVTLPRYETGEGVYAMLIAQGGYTGGQDCIINYTNSEGVSNRITTPILLNTATFTASNLATISLGTQVTASRTYGWPFMPLVGDDKGIRSIESITYAAPIGGVQCLVLVKPIAEFTYMGVPHVFEKDFYLDCASSPKIYNGAYLNLIMELGGVAAAATTLNGTLETVWGES